MFLRFRNRVKWNEILGLTGANAVRLIARGRLTGANALRLVARGSRGEVSQGERMMDGAMGLLESNCNHSSKKTDVVGTC